MSSHSLEMLKGCGYCAQCGGFEGSLPTECPGERMARAVEQRVYAGSIDFVGGQWRSKPVRGLVIRMRGYYPADFKRQLILKRREQGEEPDLAPIPLTAVDRWRWP